MMFQPLKYRPFNFSITPFLFLLTPLLFLFSCGPQKGKLRVRGEFQNLPQADLLIYSPDGVIPTIDTLHIVKGKFDYQTPLPDDESYSFVIIYPNFMTLSFMAHRDSEVRIEGDALSLGNEKVTGADSLLTSKVIRGKSPLTVGKRLPQTDVFSLRKGTYTLVSFSANWRHGAGNTNYFIRHALETCPDSLRAFTYSLDVTPDDYRRFRKSVSDTLRWTSYCDYRAWAGLTLSRLGIRNIPYWILVGPDAKVLAKGGDFNRDIKPEMNKIWPNKL